MSYKYYEIEFADGSCMCSLGEREPTVAEANEFWKKDVELYNEPIVSIYELDNETAHESYDMRREKEFPIFK